MKRNKIIVAPKSVYENEATKRHVMKKKKNKKKHIHRAINTFHVNSNHSDNMSEKVKNLCI